jgi:hypothetical protein
MSFFRDRLLRKLGRLDAFRPCDTRSLEGIVSIMGPLLLLKHRIKEAQALYKNMQEEGKK